MQKIRTRRFLRSFSVRIGVLVFVMLCITMTTLRIISYVNSISSAYNDIRLIVNAHLQEIDEAMELHGLAYVKKLVQTTVEESRDKHLFLALRTPKSLVGNLTRWPAGKSKPHGWSHASVPRPASGNVYSTGISGSQGGDVEIYYRIVRYPHNVDLLVGYDMQRVNLIRETLTNVLVSNTIVSIFLSFAIVVLVIWLLNRHLQRFNVICDQVMEGNLGYRIELHDSADQFDRLGNNLNRMLDWINLLINTVKDTSNSIAHDMRTPISRLRLELRALSEKPELPGHLRGDVLGTIDQLDAVVAMFDNILNIAKAESNTTRELFDTINFSELVTDVVDLYEPLLEEKHLELIRHIPDTEIPYLGDKQLIGQSLANLLDNAVKFAREGGRIEVTLEVRDPVRGERELRVTVADSGPGIPAELRDKVIQRFFRLDKSRNSAGVGLGLSLVNAVMQLHQGELVLEDNQPGLKATLIFPL